MERIKRHLRSAAGYLLVCAKWLALAALVSCSDEEDILPQQQEKIVSSR